VTTPSTTVAQWRKPDDTTGFAFYRQQLVPQGWKEKTYRNEPAIQLYISGAGCDTYYLDIWARSSAKGVTDVEIIFKPYSC
jgi:hypothetical protein